MRLLFSFLFSIAVHVGVGTASFWGERHAGSRAAATAGRSLPRAGLQLAIVGAPTSQSANVSERLAVASTRHPGETTKDERVGVNLLPIQGLPYYSTTELTRPPEPAAPLVLDSTELGLLDGSGTLVLTIWVNDLGQVVNALVESKSVSDQFAEFALSAFKQTRFVPGEREGKRVGSIMRIEIRYDDLSGAAPVAP